MYLVLLRFNSVALLLYVGIGFVGLVLFTVWCWLLIIGWFGCLVMFAFRGGVGVLDL